MDKLTHEQWAACIRLYQALIQADGANTECVGAGVTYADSAVREAMAATQERLGIIPGSHLPTEAPSGVVEGDNE